MGKIIGLITDIIIILFVISLFSKIILVLAGAFSSMLGVFSGLLTVILIIGVLCFILYLLIASIIKTGIFLDKIGLFSSLNKIFLTFSTIYIIIGITLNKFNLFQYDDLMLFYFMLLFPLFVQLKGFALYKNWVKKQPLEYQQILNDFESNGSKLPAKTKTIWHFMSIWRFYGFIFIDIFLIAPFLLAVSFIFRI